MVPPRGGNIKERENFDRINRILVDEQDEETARSPQRLKATKNRKRTATTNGTNWTNGGGIART
jgi:hypothetical protein